MGTFIGLIVIVVIYAIFKSSEITKFQNKNPLDVDNSKMTRDVCNGVSKSEIRRRYANGYYDKDK